MIHLSREDSALVREFMIMRKQLNLYLNHFPNYEKHALSLRIRNKADEVFENIVKGVKKYHKITTLTDLDVAHEQLRSLVYLAYELEYFNYSDTRDKHNNGVLRGQERYICISAMIDSVGRLVGAWIQNEKSKDKK